MPNEVKLLPCIPTPEMIAAAWSVIDREKKATGVAKLGPGLGVREIWQAMFEASRPTTVVTDEVVERVAKAIAESEWDKNCNLSGTPNYSRGHGWARFLSHARAAIEAMPTVVTGEQPDMDQALAAILAKDDTEVMLDELRELFGTDLDVDSRFTIAQVMTAMESSFRRGVEHIEMVNRAMIEAKARSAQPGDA